jgi:hypothetical protein
MLDFESFTRCFQEVPVILKRPVVPLVFILTEDYTRAQVFLSRSD